MKRTNILDKVVEYVLTRETWEFEDLNVDSIAGRFKVSRSYLSHRFKGEKKFSLSDYIFLIKIIRSSLILLGDEEVTVEELSKLMGFSSANYFIIVFRKWIGTTPGRYKNHLKMLKSIKSLSLPGK